MSKRILVVEGQKDNRQIIRDTLTGSDYQITEAKDGEQALAAVAKQRPDLILMGIQLPIIDGYEVTRRIKADPAMRSIPIIAVTSHALDGEEQTARAAGRDGYVPEPYTLDPNRPIREADIMQRSNRSQLLGHALLNFCQ